MSDNPNKECYDSSKNNNSPKPLAPGPLLFRGACIEYAVSAKR